MAIEKARLAADVYNPKNGPPEGWKNISNDEQALKIYGLKPELLESPDSNFRAQIYEPDISVFGQDLKPTISFKGTESGEDWMNNFRQGVDMESPYYRRAVSIGTALGKASSDIEITGHSLGGGMASAASRASGKSAITFNAAGLNVHTLGRYGSKPVIPMAENIQAFQVAGEVLTGIQEQNLAGELISIVGGAILGGKTGAVIGALGKIGISSGTPDAIGDRYSLPGHGGLVDRHGMDHVIEGIERQKDEDKKKISDSLQV